MRKKLWIVFIAIMMCFCFGFSVACNNEVKTQQGGDQNKPTGTPEDEIKYEGNMLYNGFDSVDDLYRVKQLFDWTSFQTTGKLEIVGADNFISETDNSDAEEAAAAVVAMIEKLPAASAVTEFSTDTIDAVAKARRAYGELTDEGKLLVSNIGKLKELETSDALKGYYTLSDFGGGFVSNITGAPSWTAYSGTLRDPMQGIIVFNVSGIAANTDGAIYLSLFQDPSEDAGQSGDGVAVWVRTNNNTLLPQNSTNLGLAFETGENGESKTITADNTYTFYVGYTVAEQEKSENTEESAYALTISIKIVDAETGDVVADVETGEITKFTTNNFGNQTIQNWLIDGDNIARHQTFFITTGASENVNISSLWTGTKESDYSEPTEDQHVESDLSPRQGDGALRITYERGAFTEILARFDRSSLSGMPIENKFGGFSAKIYNDSAVEKTVELSLMKEQNEVVSVENGIFTLAPYAWTECKVTLDPIIINYLADKLIGLNIRFNNTTESVYYVDDLRVQFGQTYTDEIKTTIEKVNALTKDITENIDGKTIASDDKEMLETLYAQYIELPAAYRFTVENFDLLDEAISDYFNVLSSESGTENETIFHFDELLGVTQVGAASGVKSVSFSEDEYPEGDNGSLKLEFDGSAEWITIPITSVQLKAYDEIHVWVKNDSDYKRAFELNWRQVDEAIGGTLVANYILPANSGWIELIYRAQWNVNEFNITSVDNENVQIGTVDSLYVGKIFTVNNAPKVQALIDALPEYKAGYSEENKAAVTEARVAYNALNIDTRNGVTNFDKLIAIEADIWREGFTALPVSPDGITEFKTEWKNAIAVLREAYNALDNAVKKAVAEDEAILQEFEEKIAGFQVENVTSLIDSLTIKDSYSAKDIANIKAAKDAYDALDMQDKAKIPQESVKKLENCLDGIANYYTLTDLTANCAYPNNLAQSNIAYPTGGWTGYGANLVNSMKGTIVFNVTGLTAGADGALLFSFFHDPSMDAGQSEDGIAVWLRLTNNTLYASNSTQGAFGFEEGASISANSTYTFYVGYEVAEDYSKLTLSVRIEDMEGRIIADGSLDISEVSLTNFGKQSIEDWVKGETHQTFYVNSGNSTANLVVSAAW